jgi:hypothetical protein
LSSTSTAPLSANTKGDKLLGLNSNISQYTRAPLPGYPISYADAARTQQGSTPKQQPSTPPLLDSLPDEPMDTTV